MTSVSCDVVCFESCRITCRVKLLCPNHKHIAIKISVVLLCFFARWMRILTERGCLNIPHLLSRSAMEYGYRNHLTMDVVICVIM